MADVKSLDQLALILGYIVPGIIIVYMMWMSKAPGP